MIPGVVQEGMKVVVNILWDILRDERARVDAFKPWSWCSGTR